MQTSRLLDFISEDFRAGFVKYFRIYLFLTFLDLYWIYTYSFDFKEVFFCVLLRKNFSNFYFYLSTRYCDVIFTVM